MAEYAVSNNQHKYPSWKYVNEILKSIPNTIDFDNIVMKFNILNDYINSSCANREKSKHISEAMQLREDTIHLAMRYFYFETCETVNPISKFLGFEVGNDVVCKKGE